jgi:hypothetical protein
MAAQRNRLPLARPSEELVIEQLPEELLIYDKERHEAHCLNRAAAAVFRRCDGKTEMDEMVGLLAEQGLPADERVVELALDELRKAQLLRDDQPAPTGAYLRSRRKMLRQILFVAGAAVALPIVQSIVAPSVAQAASGCAAKGQDCSQKPCCIGPCLGGVCKN